MAIDSYPVLGEQRIDPPAYIQPMDETVGSQKPPLGMPTGHHVDQPIDGGDQAASDPVVDVDLRSMAEGIALLDELDAVLADLESGIRRHEDTDSGR